MADESIRDSLESVIETTESTTTTESTPAATPAAAPTPAPAPAETTGAATPAPAPAPAEGTPTEGSPTPSGITEASGEPKPGTTTPAPGPNDYLAKPPGTWTPEAREHWNTLPPQVREQVWKRDREASRALTISTQARKFQDEFQQTIQPYMGFIAAEQSTPIRAVQNLMQTAAVLRVGTPQQKVQVVAEVIKNFGIDLRALDELLADGQVRQADPQTLVQQAVAQAVAPLQQAFQQQLRQTEAAVEAEVEHDLVAFASDPKHEFYNDVREVMADIMEVAQRRGVRMGLTEAYERATLMVEPVRRVIEQRKTTQSAQQAHQAAAAARNASVSIPSSTNTAKVVPQAGDDIRSSIEFALANHSGG